MLNCILNNGIPFLNEKFSYKSFVNLVSELKKISFNSSNFVTFESRVWILKIINNKKNDAIASF